MSSQRNTNQCLLRKRRSRPGPERRLLKAAEECLPRKSVILRELTLPTGNPDLVLAFPRRSIVLSDGRKRLNIEHFQVLHALCETGTVTHQELAQVTNRTTKIMSQLLDDLMVARLVTITSDQYSARSAATIIGTSRIIAIEGKISDWRTAIQQATANLWFASESYVLLPNRRMAERALESAASQGVGILVLNEGNLETAFKARSQSLPASYGSWVIGEIALRKGAHRDRSSHRRIP